MNWRGSFNQRCKVYTHEIKQRCVPVHQPFRKTHQAARSTTNLIKETKEHSSIGDECIIDMLIDFGDKYFIMR